MTEEAVPPERILWARLPTGGEIAVTVWPDRQGGEVAFRSTNDARWGPPIGMSDMEVE